MELSLVSSWTEQDAENTLLRIFEDRLPKEVIVHIFKTLYAAGDSLNHLRMHLATESPLHSSLWTLGLERWKGRWLEKGRFSFPCPLSLTDQRARCVIHNHLNRNRKTRKRMHSTMKVVFFEVPRDLRRVFQPLLPNGSRLMTCWIHATPRVAGNLYAKNENVDEEGNTSLQNAVFWDRPQVESVIFDTVQFFPSGKGGYGLCLEATFVLVRERDA